MLFGAQIRQSGGLLAALRRAEAMGAEVMQVFAQSPRQWRYPEANPDRAEAFRAVWPASPVVKQVFCHAPYLVNLATADPELLAKSRRCLVDNLRGARAMGAFGLVLHLGSHLGAGFEARLDAVASSVLAALDGAETGEGCPLLLENTAGAGGTIGRTFEELAQVIERTGSDPRVGVCLDTQHLWASGVRFDTPAAADKVVRRLERTVGLDRLACLHVNDSKVGLGAGLDRHENVGSGAIGEDGFRALLGHPRLQGLPAVLEVPGTDNRGPDAAQLATARRLHAEGLSLRDSRRGGTRTGSPGPRSSG
ncbi:MAG: deoxyribonuclease IV [Actinomycetota bacterium]|nr:deoxyribonuclease IV [Actinomycetota bacterium]